MDLAEGVDSVEVVSSVEVVRLEEMEEADRCRVSLHASLPRVLPSPRRSSGLETCCFLPKTDMLQ